MAWLLGRSWPILERCGNRAVAVTPGCGCRPTGGTIAQNRAETSYRRPLSQPWVAAWCPLPLKFRTRSYQPQLHSIIDIATRAILDYHVTDGYTSDITCMWPMLDRLADGNGNFCLDPAYLARLICDAIDAKGMTPRIRPKSNTVCKNGGSQAWGDMARTHRYELARFMDEYRQRSTIEAVFGAIKRMLFTPMLPQVASGISSRPSLGQSRECMGTTSGAAGAPGRAGR